MREPHNCGQRFDQGVELLRAMSARIRERLHTGFDVVQASDVRC